MSNPQVIDYTKDSKFKTESKFRSDDCYKGQQNYDNKSIFRYMTDSNMFVNENTCLDTTPPFLSYIPAGIPIQSIDIENDLRGINRPNTRCSSKKWNSPNPDLAATISKDVLFNKNVCKSNIKWNGMEFVLTTK